MRMARSSRRSSKGRSRTVFARRNYVLLLIGVALVAVGFALMRIDGQFESVVSLYVAPLLILGDRKSTRLNSSHIQKSRMPSSA